MTQLIAVCYALFIYLLNLFLAFLTPKFDPAYESDLAAQDVEDGAPGLPTSASAAGGLMSDVFHPSTAQDQDEFRPFIRRLPEFKFWLSATHATALSLLATLFSVFDVPVFWPILVLYFVILFIITMRRQIEYVDPALTQTHDPVQVSAVRHRPQGAVRPQLDYIVRGWHSRDVAGCAGVSRTYTTRYDVAPVGLGEGVSQVVARTRGPHRRRASRRRAYRSSHTTRPWTSRAYSQSSARASPRRGA